MDRRPDEYVEIEYETGPGTTSRERIYFDAFPDVIVSTNPIELQEVQFSAGGKGRRLTYSHRDTTAIKFNTNRLFQPSRNKLHKHDYFELIINASGQFEMQVESQLCLLDQWDVCILNRSTRHLEHHRPGERLYYLALTPEYLLSWPQEPGIKPQHARVLQKFFSKGLRDNVLQNRDFIVARHTSQAMVPPIHEIVEGIRREFDLKAPGYHLVVRGLLYRLLCTLSDGQSYRAEYIDLGADDGFSLAFSAKQLLDKTKRKLTTGEIADQLNYSGEYINRVFKRHYNYTIPEYNRQICLKQAADLLSGTDRHVHDICKQLGFTSRTHFYHLFETEYGCTPAQYRKTASRR